jgi:hypothetical protein
LGWLGLSWVVRLGTQVAASEKSDFSPDIDWWDRGIFRKFGLMGDKHIFVLSFVIPNSALSSHVIPSGRESREN